MDTKLQTFLTLCRLMNYRMTAEQLHLSQPAVTKQIQSLEQQYGVKLFTYDGRKLEKTPKCHALEKYCESLQYNYDEIKREMDKGDDLYIRVGATKTIGDYVIGPQIEKHLSDKENGLSLVVDNTENLLNLLDNAKLDFAVIEGFFDKGKYDYELLKKEPFVGICNNNHRFVGQTVSVEEALRETLIVREDGSGTRDILEYELKNLGYNLEGFDKMVSISSFKLIKELVSKGMGFTFAYHAIINGDSDLATFRVKGFNLEHELHIVYLKGTQGKRYVDAFFGNQ